MLVPGDEDVGGLDVAVNNALAVRGLQSFGDFDGEREQAFDVHGTAGDAMLQGYAVQKFHGNERLLAVLADFVDGADVGMIESRGGACLAAEALQRLRVARHFVGQEFEGDEAAEVGVFGLVDDAHAAAAELVDDAVVRDGLADHSLSVIREEVSFVESSHLTDEAPSSQRMTRLAGVKVGTFLFPFCPVDLYSSTHLRFPP